MPRLRSIVASRFEAALGACLRGIPAGKVATCGTVARALGDVRAARSVAAWLLDHPDTEMGHRVVRADGRPILQASAGKLGAEGVRFMRSRAPPESFVDVLPGAPLLAELRREQLRLAERVQENRLEKVPEVLGGVDVAYEGERAYAVAVEVDARTLEATEIVGRELAVEFPYIPTYLAFREMPAIEAAVHALRAPPDVLFVDGHGRLHPALFGFACFAGVRLGLPTIGIAKRPLAGTLVPSQRQPDGTVPIMLDGRVRGYAWPPPESSRSIYVSVGHRVTLEEALELTRRATRARYPEPLRLADRMSKEMKRKKIGKRDASERAA